MPFLSVGWVFQDCPQCATVSVKDILSFPNNEHKDVQEMVLQFIDESDHEGMEICFISSIP